MRGGSQASSMFKLGSPGGMLFSGMSAGSSCWPRMAAHSSFFGYHQISLETRTETPVPSVPARSSPSPFMNPESGSCAVLL